MQYKRFREQLLLIFKKLGLDIRRFVQSADLTQALFVPVIAAKRSKLIREQLAETPEKSDRQIAAGLGVSHVTVGTQRKELESTGQIDQLATNIGADGKERPSQVQRKPVSVFNPTPREEKGQ